MAREAKKAAKLEKKLRTLTAGIKLKCIVSPCIWFTVVFSASGYQARSQALHKQTQDLIEQIEAARCELDTYTFLKKHEDGMLVCL